MPSINVTIPPFTIPDPGTNNPAFIAAVTVAVPIPASTTLATHPIIYNNVFRNVGGGYSGTTGTFTAQIAGYYHTTASFAPGIVSSAPAVANYGSAALVIYRTRLVATPGFPAGDFQIATGSVINDSNAEVLTNFISQSSATVMTYMQPGDTLRCRVHYKTEFTGYTTMATPIRNLFSIIWLRP